MLSIVSSRVNSVRNHDLDIPVSTSIRGLFQRQNVADHEKPRFMLTST